jgi:hypothetical protein
MKKIITALLVTGCFAIASAQEPVKTPKDVNPEKRAEKMVQKLDEKLNLTTEQ